MTKPVKVTPKQFKKLERNLNGGGDPKKADKVLIGLLHRMYWWNWSRITGKTLSFEELHSPRSIQRVNDFVREFLPELRKGK